MGAKRYGPATGQSGVALSEYHQSKDELAGLPVTVAGETPRASATSFWLLLWR